MCVTWLPLPVNDCPTLPLPASSQSSGHQLMHSSICHSKHFSVHILVTTTSRHLPRRICHHVMLFYSTQPLTRLQPVPCPGLGLFLVHVTRGLIIESESESSIGLNPHIKFYWIAKSASGELMKMLSSWVASVMHLTCICCTPHWDMTTDRKVPKIAGHIRACLVHEYLSHLVASCCYLPPGRQQQLVAQYPVDFSPKHIYYLNLSGWKIIIFAFITQCDNASLLTWTSYLAFSCSKDVWVILFLSVSILVPLWE